MIFFSHINSTLFSCYCVIVFCSHDIQISHVLQFNLFTYLNIYLQIPETNVQICKVIYFYLNFIILHPIPLNFFLIFAITSILIVHNDFEYMNLSCFPIVEY